METEEDFGCTSKGSELIQMTQRADDLLISVRVGMHDHKEGFIDADVNGIVDCCGMLIGTVGEILSVCGFLLEQQKDERDGRIMAGTHTIKRTESGEIIFGS